MTNLRVKYPARKRCASCRRYLSAWDAYEGLYCSWGCSPKGPPPEIPVEDLPRQCKHRKRDVGWKEKFTYNWIEDARQHCPEDKSVYHCEHHRGWHIGGGPRSKSGAGKLP